MTENPVRRPAEDPHPYESSDVTRQRTVALVRRWIERERPAALIRFGEGEGRLLVADPADPDSVGVAARKIRRQTGLKLSPEHVLEIKELIMEALRGADVVAIRGSDSFNEEHKMWVQRIEQVWEEQQAYRRRRGFVTHCLVSNDLRDALPELLEDQDIVSIVSCRDLGDVMRERYGVSNPRLYQIPSQYIMRDVDGSYESALHGVPIWPKFYKRLIADITPRRRGEVFLVGAGLFGKHLCVRIRSRGGIALDLGSCLDGLAGKVTRGPGRPKPYRPPSSK